MFKIQIRHNDDPSIPDFGVHFYSCTQCLADMPEDETPKNWARQQVSLTKEGNLQVWCTRHNVNIDLIKWELVDKTKTSNGGK